MLLLKPRKHYIKWHTTISKIVHPSLSKDIKSIMQIKRDKCCSLMLLCLKIYCIKLEPNKQSSYHHQARPYRVLFQTLLRLMKDSVP